MNIYNTKQKADILLIIKKQNKEFTVKNIYNELNKKVGLTTIYRFIDKLVQDNKLNKYITKDNITYYQYLNECDMDNHFFLKCDKCGTLIHIDCDCINDLSNHIYNHHKFKLNKDNIIINGICEECSREGV